MPVGTNQDQILIPTHTILKRKLLNIMSCLKEGWRLVEGSNQRLKKRNLLFQNHDWFSPSTWMITNKYMLTWSWNTYFQLVPFHSASPLRGSERLGGPLLERLGQTLRMRLSQSLSTFCCLFVLGLRRQLVVVIKGISRDCCVVMVRMWSTAGWLE